MKFVNLGTLSEPKPNDFEKCQYCVLWNGKCGIGGQDGRCTRTASSLYKNFKLNPFTAIIAAKNYEITVTDVLNLIEACVNTKTEDK